MAKKKQATKRFHLGDILGVMVGVGCPPNGFEGVKDVLMYMTGESPYTTQAGRFADECLPYLREQFPSLAHLTADDLEGNEDENRQAFGKLVAQFGAWHNVRPIHPEDHQVIDVQVELAMTRPDIEPLIIDISDFQEGNGEA